MPDAVESFEKTVSSLPGFEQQGTVTRLVLVEDFTDVHLEELMFGAYRLKSAEKTAH
jgi:hypothetical protein